MLYIKDQNDRPIEATEEEWIHWHESLPDNQRTILGKIEAHDVIDGTEIITLFLCTAVRPGIHWITMVMSEGQFQEIRFRNYKHAMAGHDGAIVNAQKTNP